MARILLTKHAVKQFNDRVRPTLNYDAAEIELRRLLDQAGEPSEKPPPWLVTAIPGRAYLTLADGIALALNEGRRGDLCAYTCLTRDGMPSPHRERRNEHAASRRARRQAKRRKRSERKLGNRDKRSGRRTAAERYDERNNQ